MILISSI